MPQRASSPSPFPVHSSCGNKLSQNNIEPTSESWLVATVGNTDAHHGPIDKAEGFVVGLLGLLSDVATLRRDPHRIFSNVHRLHEQLLVLEHVYSFLLHRGYVCTQRDVYYHLSRFFKDQISVNLVLQQVCTIMECSRSEINVRAGNRGYIGGSLELEGQKLWTLGQQGMAIDGKLAEIESTRENSEARITYCPNVNFGKVKAILVVEKDAVYQRLMSEKIYEYFPCVLITGMGYPPLAVQALLRCLIDISNADSKCHSSSSSPLRVVGIVDYNPSGVHILLQYLHGSKRHKNGSFYGVQNLKWLGLRSADLAFAESSRIHPLTEREQRSLVHLNSTKGAERVPTAWREEIREMARRGVKADIEALYTSSASTSFSRMIAQRIMQGDFI